MDARLKTWMPRLLFALVLVLLALVGVIQYQWFSRSAAGEIDGSIRGLQASVRQSAAREFQRYAPLVAEAQGPLSLGSLAEQKALAQRWLATYGPSGTAPGLLSWVGVGQPGQTTFERLGTDGHWTTVELPAGPWSGRGRNADLAAASGPSADQLVILSPRGTGGLVFLLGLDGEGLMRTYVAPALAELYPGSQLTWAPGRRGPPPAGEEFDSRTYAFNPMTALFATTNLPRTFTVDLPNVLEARSGAPAAGSPAIWSLSSWTLKLTVAPDAPVLGIERRLAWNWAGSTVLLVVLGLAFGLVLGQWSRSAELRRREREFVASVSHELRTPLTVIRSAADNFTRGIVAPERQGRYGQLILDQSLRLGRMVEQILAFAQAEAAPAAPVQAPLVFGTWLAELRPPLEDLALGRGVHLVWDVAGVPAGGRTDPEGLRSILENLVVNALNHAYPAPGPETGHRSVRVTLRHLVPDRLELTVDDDGRGISPKEAKNVFEPFYRDQVSRNNQEKGSGLGLFLARRQARRLGGDLKLESPWKRADGAKRPGCRFTATLPFWVGRHAEEAGHGS